MKIYSNVKTNTHSSKELKKLLREIIPTGDDNLEKFNNLII